VTAITEAPESLDWVRFSDEDELACQAMSTECPREPVAAAFFDAPCGYVPVPQRLCAEHRDRTIAKSLEWDGVFRCFRCLTWITLLRIEPIR
jgi:hypothetical protein